MAFGASPQSAGAGWMHQIFPGSSSASPTSQYLPPVPSETQLATRAGALVPPGSSSSKTGRPASNGWARRTPHPSVLTTSVWQCSLNGTAGSRLASRKGICARIRVLRRAASPDFAPALISRLSLDCTSRQNPRSRAEAPSRNQSNHGDRLTHVAPDALVRAAKQSSPGASSF